MSTLRNIHRKIEYHMRSFIWDFLFLRLGQILKPNSDNVETLYREKKDWAPGNQQQTAVHLKPANLSLLMIENYEETV